jgi:hypothetical protein
MPPVTVDPAKVKTFENAVADALHCRPAKT